MSYVIAPVFKFTFYKSIVIYVIIYIYISFYIVYSVSLNVCEGFVWGSPVVDIRGGWAPTDPHSHVISLHKGLVKSVIPHASSPFDSVGQLWANGYYAPYKRGAVLLSVLRPPLSTAKLGSIAPQTQSLTHIHAAETLAHHMCH